MKSIDFLVLNDRQRTLTIAPGVETGLIRAVLNTQTADAIKERYDAVITPGNSFGHMTGGFDLGVVQVFGREAQHEVLKMIKDKYNGMMPVGSAEVVVVRDKAIVYVPTAMVPTSMTGVLDPYMLMHQALRAYATHLAESATFYERLLCPLFCTGAGSADPNIALYQQNQALVEFQNAKHGEYLGCKDIFGDGQERFMELLSSR
jgi:O-acetyl-ADP-ribose deacetylase (regulator of RNase III)